jgi:hypothetical protein
MSSQLVVLCMGINSKSFSVIANLEWQPRMITASYVTSLTSVLSSVGMEKTWKCLEMSHNWIFILFAMSCMCSASVFHVRLIFWKSFTYQDTILAVLIKHSLIMVVYFLPSIHTTIKQYVYISLYFLYGFECIHSSSGGLYTI